MASGSNRRTNSKIRSSIFIGNRFESTLWRRSRRARRLRNMNTKLSNASGALDKHQFLVITQHELLKDGVKLDIRIQTDKDNGIITITDSGISMTRDELVSSLGTITESGTAKSLKAVKESKDVGADSSLIGLFGVGLYSVFLVSDNFMGHVIYRYVSSFVNKSQRQGLLPQGQNCNNIYVKNLEPDMIEEDDYLLQSKFFEYGDVCSAVVMKDEHDQNHFRKT